jgi:small-conductance mechanosensitive channel
VSRARRAKPTPRTKRAAPARATRAPAPRRRTGGPVNVTVREIDAMRDELKRQVRAVPRWNADPDDVQRSVARLVLSLVEFLRKLMERQAIRRMEAGTLTPGDIESVGQALMRLEETVRDIAARFDLRPEELNLDLGPIGRLT